jgi:beta-lactamase regulating signal transducer with metallopeptidase domain/N-acetylglutamate synthase-like GNAT family acetyltransferase
MNGIATLLGTPLAEAIGWALLHLLWQGLLVAAILAATLALLSKQSANARYLASCGALALLVVLGAATAYRSYVGSGELGVGSGSGANSAALFAISAGTETPAVASSDTPLPTLHALITFTRSHLPQIVLVWLTGVLLLSVRLLFGWLRAHSIARRNAGAAAPEWQKSAARLARALNLRKGVQLLESAAVEVPTVIGWLRPVILLPAATLTGLSTEQMEMILAHELAHIRRNDFFVNLAQALIETLLFYHPAVWWISHRIRVERENCCDDVAVSVSGKPLVYARALTRLEELRIDDARAFVAANGGSLIGRIRRLAGARAESPNAPSRFVAGAALLTVLLALLIAPSMPLRGQQQKADPATVKPKAAQTTVEVKAENSSSEEADEPEASDPEVDDAMPAPMIAPRAIAGIPGGIAGGIAEGIAGGIAGGVAGGIADGVVANAFGDDGHAVAIAPRMHALTTVAPRIALRALSRINDGDFALAQTPEPDAPRAERRHHEIGEGGKLSVDDLIELRSVGVTPAYIDAMRGAGLGELSLSEIEEMKAVGVSLEYIRALHDAGIKFDGVHNLIELRAVGVTPDYVSQMHAAGYTNLTTKQLTELRAVGVTPAYVKQLADAGYRNATPRELAELRAEGVRADFIKSLRDAGYTNLSVKDLVRMAAMGVNADFIRDLAKYKVK